MNKQQFSVVIPLYNKAEHIKRALDSVLTQTVNDIEIIVVNDGSTDGSEKIVEEYTDHRVRLINQKNGGESVARNTGIEASRMPYIAFLDADDAWEKDFLSIISGLIREYPEAGAYATALKTKEPSGEYKEYTYTPLPSHPWQGILENYFECLAHDSYPLSSSTICIKKQILDQVGNFDTSLQIGPDIDMWIRIFLTTKIAFSTHIGAIYYRDAENRSTNIINFNQKEFEFLEHLYVYLSDMRMNSGYQRGFRQYLSHKLYTLTLRGIANSQRILAIKVLQKFWKLFNFKQIISSVLRLMIPKQIFEFIRK